MIKTYLHEKALNSTFHDEMIDENGNIVPAWERLARFYENMSAEKMEQFHEEVSRQLRENGVTYNIYGDPEGMNRPWSLDPIPMVFSREEWAVVESGMVQRATLLNLIFEDIYGSRSLITEGLLPFELIYSHKGFIRQADKLRFEGVQQIIQYSADLARGSNGKMWVLHDRTDAPSGAGYTFENRSAMTRVFPDLIRENQVRRISGYYQTLKNTLVGLSSKNIENPRIVLLSPGPNNETYFEHAYISSLMGFTLSFGQDLTVSDGYVWLKTIKGLERVDVIIRRVDDLYCDPLEFRSDSHLGVVGLMEAIRQKKVLVVNPIGVRILENPGIMAFLPAICKHLLGEELKIPSVATWWCGQKKEKDYVLANIDNLVIRNIFRDTSTKAKYGALLSKEEKDQLKLEIEADPFLYVGQEMVEFSTTPAWIDKKLVARNAVFRSYVVADINNKTYNVMPGGLSRSSPQKGLFLVSNQAGGISKDTWVLGKGYDTIGSYPQQKPNKQTVRTILPSRTGEHLFWLGRYMERTASTVRLMRMVLLTYNESESGNGNIEDKVLATLLKSLTSITAAEPGFTKSANIKKPEKELLALATDIQKIGSLAQSIQAFLSNGYAVRDRLSLDTWRILDSINEELQRMKNHNSSLTQIHQSLDNLVIKMMAFYGLNLDNMTREPTYYLLNTGRFIESAINNCITMKALLSKKESIEIDKALMEHTLRSNESLVTYRYRYRSNFELSNVLSLLMINEENPRSLIYQILQIDINLSQLPNQDNVEGLPVVRKKILEAIMKIRLCDLQKLVSNEPSKTSYIHLATFLDEIKELIKEVSNLTFEKYFSHTSGKYSMIQSTILPEI